MRLMKFMIFCRFGFKLMLLASWSLIQAFPCVPFSGWRPSKMNFICCSDYRTLSLEISFPSGTCMFHSTCKVEPRLGVQPHSVSQDYRAESNEVSWRCFGACIVQTCVQQLLYAFFFFDLYGYNLYNIDDHWHSWAISAWVDEVSIWDNRC